MVSNASGGIEELPTLKSISGIIVVSSGEKNLPVGNVLTLHLEDGRKWPFFVSHEESVPGAYYVVNASRDGIVFE